MSFTDKENIAIREKLSEMELPSMDEAWTRMSEKMGPPPVQKGVFQRLLEKYSLYLNAFIGVIILASGVLLHSAVQRNEFTTQTFEVDLPSFNNDIQDDLIATIYNPKDNTLPIASLSMEPVKVFAPEVIASIAIEESVVKNSTQKLIYKENIIVDDSRESLIEAEIPLFTIDRPVSDNLLNERWESDVHFSEHHWGVFGGIQFMPDVALKHVIRSSSVGIFYREFWKPSSAFQVEAMLNSIAIRPIEYVQKSIVNGQLITDSSQVEVMRFVSIVPVSYHSEFRDNFSFTTGLQISGLLKLKGQNIHITGSSGGDQQKATFTSIKNVEAFGPINWALFFELDYQLTRRVSAGIRIQQSMSDLSKPKLGPSKHRYGTVNFDISAILNR